MIKEVRRRWPVAVMRRAVEVAGERGCSAAAIKFGVPRSTVAHWAKQAGLDVTVAQENVDVDVALAVLGVVCPPGVALTQREIAAVCGVSAQYIQQVEARALRKVRWELWDVIRREGLQ